MIDALRERGVASRAELARVTGLSRSTISTIVADLLEAGLAQERDGQPGGEAHAGRPPVMVSLDSSAGLALAIDFGHRHLRVAVSDLSHTVLAETWCEMDVDHSCDHGLATAAEFVDQALAEAGVERERVLGVGMGLPAPIDRATGSVQASSILPGWVGVDAAAEASARLGLPVEVENDANLGALAELIWGAGKGRSDVAYIKVSSGIGAGLISNGRLQHGVGGTAGEIGHTLLAEHGPVCRCGNRGCLETLASSRAIAELLSASRGEQVSTRQLLELCAAGDPAAQRLIGDAGQGDRGRGGEPLQHAQPRVRDRRRRAQRHRRGPARPAARGRAAKRDPERGRRPGDRRRRARRTGRDAGRLGAGDARVGSILGLRAAQRGGLRT